MRKDILLLGALHIAASLFYIFAASGIILVLYGVGSLFAPEINHPSLSTMLMVVLAIALFLFALPGVVGGIGLIRKWKWSEMLVLILGCLNLVLLPLGTVLGIYTIYVLMKTCPELEQPRIARLIPNEHTELKTDLVREDVA
ncbi:MAG: hypothetical protein ACLFQB_14720 [Chitinispirillaceae bacterium]